MVLWVDEYRPRGLANVDLHPEITHRLTKLAATRDIPHLLFVGPSGAGKKTRISALLREIYGPSVEKTKVTYRSVKTRSKTIEIATVGSTWHIELNPADAGNNDTFVVQEVIRDLAMTQSVSAAARLTTEASSSSSSSSSSTSTSSNTPSASSEPGVPPPAFKVVVLHEVDRLSQEAQHGLRRTMELYTQSCRLILCCESACRVAAPLKSRVLTIRVPAPTSEQVVALLEGVAHREKLALPAELAQRLATEADGNMRRALLALEACHVEQSPLSADQRVRGADWQRFVEDLARLVCEEQTPQRLLLARGKIYELLANCVPPEVVIKTLAAALQRRVDDSVRHRVARWAAHYEHRMATGSKPVFHLEAFLAKFMAIYRRWIVESFG